MSALALVEAGLVAGMAALVGLAFRPVFAPAPLLWPAVVAAVGAVALSTLVTRGARWPASAAALASSAVGPLVLAVVVWRVAPTPAAWVDAVRAVPAAPSRILSAPLPAPDRPELLVLLAATSWVVGHVGAELAARTRAPLAPLAPVAPALLVPLLLGVGGPRPGASLVGGLAMAAGALVMVRARSLPGSPLPPVSAGSPDGAVRPPRAVVAGPGVRRAHRRRLALAVVMVAVAGLVPAVAGDSLPFARREARLDPRGPVSDDPPQLRNPLVEVSAQRHAPTAERAFTASGPTGIELWRTAVLDDYDGVTWRSSGVYEPVGSRLPRSAAPGDGEPAPVDVTLGALASPFLPTPGRPVTLDGVDARLDATTGSLLADDPLGEGDRFTVEAAVGVPSDGQLDLAVRDRSGADAVVARRPVVNSASLAQTAAREVRTRTALLDGTADIRQLRALQDFFADQGRFRLATEPVGGLTLRHLTAFVGTAANGGISEASIEQFAAAYAVMARTLGYATRVVVGYRTPDPPVDGVYRVENHDAFAWAEVKLEGLGWVPFVAAPVSTAEAPPPPPPAVSVTTTTAPQSSTVPDDDAAGEQGLARRRAPADGGGARARVLVAAGVLSAAALALLLTGAPAARALRRRRRRRGTAAEQVDGAWREVVDGLASYRFPVTRAMTVPEVLAMAAGHAGTAPPAAAADLARVANDVRYGPGPPGPDAPENAWRGCTEVLAWGRGQLRRRARARAFVDLGATLRGAP